MLSPQMLASILSSGAADGGADSAVNPMLLGGGMDQPLDPVMEQLRLLQLVKLSQSNPQIAALVNALLMRSGMSRLGSRRF